MRVKSPVVSDSVQPYGLRPARRLSSWDSSGKNTRVGCHALLQGIFPDPGIKPHLISPALAGRFFTTRATWEAPHKKIGKRKEKQNTGKKKQKI